MTHRYFAAVFTLIAVVALFPLCAAAQSTDSARTPWGQQDLDADTLEYTFTVTDPETWSSPWTASMPMRRTDIPLFEYACHEGNYSMEGILAGTRAEEKAAAHAVTQRSSSAIQLFNGQDLDGWEIVNNGQFSVEDGVLRVNRGTGWLRSRDRFGDFVLTMEFRFLEEEANSGIFVRTGPTSRDDERGWPDNGYQIQCMDIITGDTPLGQMIPYGAPPFEHEFDIEALNEAYNPTGEWQTYEITAKGENLSVRLNGILITTATSIKNLTGHIGIQGELGLLEFRKIEVEGI